MKGGTIMSTSSVKKVVLSGTVFFMLSLSGGGLVFASTGNSSGLNGIGQQQTKQSNQTSSSGTTSSSSNSSTPVKSGTQSSQPTQPATLVPSSTTTSTTTSQTGTTGTTSSQAGTTASNNRSNANAVGSMISGLGVDQKSANRAKAIVAPLARWANIGFAIVLAFTFIAMFLITALDLMYIAVPPIRNFLVPGGVSPQGSDMSGGGMIGGRYGGYGGGYGGGSGMMGMQQQQQQQQRSALITQLISDEAKYAVAQVTSVKEHSTPMGTMGGFGGGMMGGGMQQQPVPPSMKSVLADYMKKRIFFFIVFGICSVLFSVTIFTSIGIHLGDFLLAKLMGVNTRIPQ